MTGSYVLSFREAAQTPEHAGGKAVSLGRLAAAGFRVPGGFVLSAAAYQDFAALADIRTLTRRFSRRCEDPTAEWAQAELDRIRLNFLRTPLPESIRSALISALTQSGTFGAPLVVRSSAVREDGAAVSFAGVHRTVSNVLGIEALDFAVRQAWASLWSVRAVAYRQRAGIAEKDAAMAVVVQRLVSADAAGVAFTRNPVSGADEVVINAAWGLGESVVSGRVGPDIMVLRPHGHEMAVAHVEIGSKAWAVRPAAAGGVVWRSVPQDQQQLPALTPEQAVALAETARRIEESMGAPQDLEWARAGEDFLLLQARPLAQGRLSARAETSETGVYGGTALWEPTTREGAGGAAAPYEVPDLTQVPDLMRPRSRPWVQDVWSTASVGEVMPQVPTPLTWSVMGRAMEAGFRRQLCSIDYAVPEGTALLRCFHGRPYFNAAAFQWISWDAVGAAPEETNRLLGGGQPAILVEDGPGRPSLNGLARWRRRARSLAVTSAVVRGAPARLGALVRRSRALDAMELTTRSDLDLLEVIFEQSDAIREFFPSFLWIRAWSSRALLNLEGLLKARVGENAIGLTTAMLAGAGNMASAEQGYTLRRVAETAAGEPRAQAFFQRLARSADREAAHIAAGWQAALAGTQAGDLFAEFLARFGHRAVDETELAQPRWSEDPTYPLQAVAGLLIQGSLSRPEPGARARQATAAAQQALGIRGRLKLRALASTARYGARLRENSKSVLVRWIAFFRRLALEVGERLERRGFLESRDDVFLLSADEIRPLLLGEGPSGDLRALIESRRRRLAADQAARAPAVLVGDGRAEDARDAHRAGSVPSGSRPTQDAPLGPARRTLAGLALSAGRAEGPACVLNHPSEGARLRAGDILVAPAADPAWTPLFLRAAGVVMETGGLLSHSAIVAREYGLPAVGNAPGITAIPDGTRIAVDGSSGRVEVLGE